MSGSIIAFFGGFFLGCMFGFLLTALVVAGDKDDRP